MRIRKQFDSGHVAVLTPIESAAVPAATTLTPLGRGASNQADSGQARNPSISWQILIFVTLIFSVIASRFIDYYRAAVSWSLFRDWQYLLFAAIVSLLAFPIVYRKAQHSRNDPILVQLGMIFAAGLGWEKVLSTAADLVKPIAIR